MCFRTYTKIPHESTVFEGIRPVRVNLGTVEILCYISSRTILRLSIVSAKVPNRLTGPGTKTLHIRKDHRTT